VIINLLKNTSRRLAPGIYKQLAIAYHSCKSWVTLRDWLKHSPSFSRLQPLWRYGHKRLNTIGSLAAFRPFLYALRRRPAASPTLRDKTLEIVMLVVSDLRIDPRVLREAKALVRGGYHIKIIVPDNHTPPLNEKPLDWGPGIDFILLPWQAASYIISYPFLLGRMMLDRALQERPFAFHCHDLTTAVIGLAAARKVGALCVCDFHEWWSENVGYDYESKRYVPHPKREKRLFRRAEHLAMSRADAIVTVCDSIAEELSKVTTNGRRYIHVIRNIPPIEPVPSEGIISLRNQLAIPRDQLLLLWQGGTGIGRNIEPIIKALEYAPRVTLVIRGPSLDIFGNEYQAIAEHIGAMDRLILLDPIPSTEVVRGAVGADVGVWSLERLCKNFTYALPNKVFEYLAAGIPVIGANFPEVKKLVEDNGVGLCFDPNDHRSIGATLNHLSDNPQLLQEMRRRIAPLLQSLNAEKEFQKIVDLYDGLAAGLES
jgi:alpha-maltose-1-phosphate synthase